MTNKEAIMLLNPKTTASALAEIEYYNGFKGKEACIEAIEDACRLAIEALGKQMHNCENCRHADCVPNNHMIYCLEHSCVMSGDNCCRDWSDEYEA